MRRIFEEILTAVFMGMILPGILLSGMVWVRQDPQPEAVPVATEELVQKRKSPVVAVRDSKGSVTEKELEDYLVGVVLAEMPAYFEEEALMAQAVVARTYTARGLETGGKHGDGSICTQASCCQAYISETEYLERGGTEADLEKVRTAVLKTAGQVVTYEGALIEATYFSCSGGRTEDAAAVWGTDFPYLRSVKSPGEEEAAYFTDAVSFTADELRQRLGVNLTGEPSGWFSQVTYTSGNGVDTIMIGDRTFQGTELRKKLGLRSTAFSVTAEEGMITFHTSGYGHRVGMSQYGAEAMAVNGSSYPQILAYYYRGSELADLEEMGKIS